MKITILCEGKTEKAFKPCLHKFLKSRLEGTMPALQFDKHDGPIPKGDAHGISPGLSLLAPFNQLPCLLTHRAMMLRPAPRFQTSDEEDHDVRVQQIDHSPHFRVCCFGCWRPPSKNESEIASTPSSNSSHGSWGMTTGLMPRKLCWPIPFGGDRRGGSAPSAVEKFRHVGRAPIAYREGEPGSRFVRSEQPPGDLGCPLSVDLGEQLVGQAQQQRGPVHAHPAAGPALHAFVDHWQLARAADHHAQSGRRHQTDPVIYPRQGFPYTGAV